MAGGHRPADRPGHHHVVATVPVGDLADLQGPANARVLSFTPMPRSWTGLPAPLPTTAWARRGRRSPAACPSVLSRSAVTSSNSPAASRSPEPEHGCPPAAWTPAPCAGRSGRQSAALQEQNWWQRRSLKRAAQPPGRRLRNTPHNNTDSREQLDGLVTDLRTAGNGRQPAGDVARCRSIGPRAPPVAATPKAPPAHACR
jgi:hypothetical protein